MTHTVGVRQFRNFGLLVGSVFGVIGLWPAILRHEDVRLWALSVAGVLVLSALVVPQVLAPVYRVWMALADGLSWVNTRIILGLVFYLVVTPMALVMRSLGRDPMRRRFRGVEESYRVSCAQRPGTHMLRQF